MRQSLGERLVGGLVDVLAGGAFAALALTVLVGWEALLVALLVIPAGAAGSFAEDFQVWCFGLDPATGRVQWALVAAMLGPPPLLATGIAWVWAGTLRSLPARVRARMGMFGLLLVTAAGGGLAAVARPAEEGDLPFPAEAIRTTHEAPAFHLVDQHGLAVGLEELRGDVVVLTAVYAHCAHTCPLIVSQAQRALAELSPEERGDVHVVAVTLDPERDTPEALAALADMHGLSAPTWRFATGEPAVVEDLLDRMGVERSRDEATGVITHPNLFLVVDRSGRVAYRLTLGERQERWLVAALRALLAEGVV